MVMVNFDVIHGTKYSCEEDKGILDMKKSTLDYHTQYFGNSVKSGISSAQLKQLQVDYDNAKKKYDASPCVLNKDPERDKCIAMQQRMESSRSFVTPAYFDALKKEFEDSKCADKIREFKTEEVKSILGIYNEMDKKRIEEDSKYKAKQKIFFGVLVFCGAILLVTMFGKKE